MLRMVDNSKAERIADAQLVMMAILMLPGAETSAINHNGVLAEVLEARINMERHIGARPQLDGERFVV